MIGRMVLGGVLALGLLAGPGVQVSTGATA
jgi:hypothetical protein